MTVTTQPEQSSQAGQSDPHPRVEAAALLAYVLEARLLGHADTAADLAALRVGSPWTAWWVCYRADESAADLGIPAAVFDGACGACTYEARALSSGGPRHPDQVQTDRRCGCLEAWARRMRQPAVEIDWPRLRSCVAMVKPGSDRATVRALLESPYIIAGGVERFLSSADVRRLYPDAYGADFVRAQDAYLTSGPVQVVTLVAKPGLAGLATELKQAIRGRLGDNDRLRNHLHMPDSPGDTFADLAHLAGHAVLHDLYGRYDRDQPTPAEHRLARYRDLLARR